jgi:hypothetical protein
MNNFSQTAGELIFWGESTQDGCNMTGKCEGKIPIDLDWRECVKECSFENIKIDCDPRLSIPQQSLVFNFNFQLPAGTTQLLNFFSEPNVIQYYNYVPPNSVTGQLVINYAQLMQMLATGQKLCIYALVCIDKKYLCMAKICFSPEDIICLCKW